MPEYPKPPVFIVGAPRSGTTLLGRILDRHPALAICNETRFFEEVYPQRAAFGALERPENRERFIHELLLTARVRLLGNDLEKLRRQLMEQGVTYRDVYRCLMQFYADSQGKPRCGDKTPVHSFFTETLSEWYPGAPIIHLVRDPRDVVASLQRMPWAPKSIVNNSLFWVLFNRAAAQSQHRPEYLRVYYEQLVADPERELRRICSHIGEDYSDSLLPSGASQSYDPNGPVTKQRLGAWRDQLSIQDVSVIEWITAAGMETHGYAREAPVSIAARTKAMISTALDYARRRVHQFSYQWLRVTQPANLAAQEYCKFRSRWEATFPGLEPLHLRRHWTPTQIAQKPPL